MLLRKESSVILERSSLIAWSTKVQIQVFGLLSEYLTTNISTLHGTVRGKLAPTCRIALDEKGNLNLADISINDI